MQIKEIKPINFFYFQTETKITELSKLVGSVAKSLNLEAANLGLDVTGPAYWIYTGFEGDFNKSFTLQIAIPVADFPKDYKGEYKMKRTENFKCLSAEHYGNWLNMTQTYGKLMEYLQSHQLKPTRINREIYINCDFKDPEANYTEIQIGIE